MADGGFVPVADNGLVLGLSVRAATLWSIPKQIWVCTNGLGQDILKGALSPRDNTASGTLYIRFQVDPRRILLRGLSPTATIFCGTGALLPWR